jgi:toxin secretion/phage lysis holin
VLPIIGAGLDVVTGWIQATINGTWDSTKMKKGLYSKFGEIAVVVFVWMIDVGTNAPFNLLPWFAGYILLGEFVSIMENLDQSGVDIKFLKRLLKKAKKAVDESDEEKKDG